MKFSMTGQKGATFKYKWLLNRGNRMDRFDYDKISDSCDNTDKLNIDSPSHLLADYDISLPEIFKFENWTFEKSEWRNVLIHW